MGDSDLLEESIDCYERAIFIELTTCLLIATFFSCHLVSPSDYLRRAKDFGEVVKEKAVERNVSTEIAPAR